MHQILLSRYFREELKQRIWQTGLSWEGPRGSCSVTEVLNLHFFFYLIYNIILRNTILKMLHGILRDSKEFQSFMSQCRKNSVRGEVIRSNLLEQDACEAYKQAGKKVPRPKNLMCYSFIIKGEVRKGENHFLPHSWADGMLPSSPPLLCQVGEFFLSLHGQDTMTITMIVMTLWKNYLRS